MAMTPLPLLGAMMPMPLPLEAAQRGLCLIGTLLMSTKKTSQ
jgi:hypothetical protein